MNALVRVGDFTVIEQVSIALYKSGYFNDVKSEAQAIVKVLAGAELGLPPFASMTGIHIIQGKPVLGSNVIATLVKNDPRYNYKVQRADDQLCQIVWFENGTNVGSSFFSIKEAQAAGLTGKDNWRKYPSDMLFARAISRGARRFAPGIFGGSPVYTPDEMGADVDPDGYIDGETVEDNGINDLNNDDNGINDFDINEAAPAGPAKPEPKNGNGQAAHVGSVEDCRAWLEEKGTTTLGIVADALVMAGLYKDREHVRNTLELDEPEMTAMRDAGLVIDFRRNIKATLKVYDALVARKVD